MSASLRLVAGPQQLGRDPPPQHRARELAGVEDHVGALAQRAEHLALGPDPLDDLAVARQRVSPAGLLEPVDERPLVRLEEDDPGLEPARLELAEHRLELGEVVAAANVVTTAARRTPLPSSRKSSPSEPISRGGRLSTQK